MAKGLTKNILTVTTGRSLATLLIVFIILFAGLQLLIFLTKIFRPGATEVPTLPADTATLISIGVKLLLALYQFKISKARIVQCHQRFNMLSDVLLSGVLRTALTIMLNSVDQIPAVLISF